MARFVVGVEYCFSDLSSVLGKACEPMPWVWGSLSLLLPPLAAKLCLVCERGPRPEFPVLYLLVAYSFVLVRCLWPRGSFIPLLK